MNERKEKYDNFSIVDFVWDEAFRAWATSPTDESDFFWNSWMSKHPENAQKIDISKQIVLSLCVQNEQVETNEIERQITQILARRDAETALAREKREHWFFNPGFRKIAAIFIFLVGIGLTFYFLKYRGDKLRIVATTSGDQKNILLPDSSSIILNSNSKVTFKANWASSEPREIWLNGEGYFKIRHLDKDNKIENHERFLVHVSDVTIEVLGTTFNVRSRRNKTEIVLKEGKIRLVFNNRIRSDIIMEPAQIVTIDEKHPQNVTTSVTQPDDYSSWIHQKLVLDNSRLSTVIQYIEDNYGKKVIVNDSSLLSKRIEGTLMLDNLDDALFVLSKVLRVKVKQNDTSIYFIKK